MAIVKKHGEPWIRVSPRGRQEEPESLVAVKGEIERRRGSIDLLDPRFRTGRRQASRCAAPGLAGVVVKIAVDLAVVLVRRRDV
ncbi:hypothetical protein [Streptomyces genisteinicus]|uniref:Uncharacterized protein n=1 Tax=Streptomyces genisteinicus TaxID=2768068 RepID=A0A7H0HR24_9ACTN|nr:hypothetical protein [Streptomyces genisteinicus]QNP62990.1 hypothetical protein IAG43_08560 [Streptomyces genisteinicus]